MRKNPIGIFFIIIIIGIIFLFISGCDLIKETFDSELEKLSSQSSSISETSSSTGNISSSASIPGSSSQSSLQSSSTVSLNSSASIPNSSSQSSISNILVAEYLFSGNANDTSGNGNNGTVYGAVLTNDRFGNANKAYSFNSGDGDYIDCGNAPSLNFDNQISVSIWMFPKSYGIRLIGKSDNELSAGWLIDLLNGNQMLKVTIQPSQHLFTPTEITLNTWYYIAFTYNKTDGLTKLYVNGNLVNQTNFTSGSIYFNTKLTIGTFTSSGISYFNGFEDDIRIYNRVLSDSEIQALYHEGGW